jgi:hypothetical protein
VLKVIKIVFSSFVLIDKVLELLVYLSWFFLFVLSTLEFFKDIEPKKTHKDERNSQADPTEEPED